MKKVCFESIKFKPGKRDILTEMFEYFGIEVIDVNNKASKTTNRKHIKKLKNAKN